MRFRANCREAPARKRTEGKAPVPEYAEGRYDPRNGKPANPPPETKPSEDFPAQAACYPTGTERIF